MEKKKIKEFYEGIFEENFKLESEIYKQTQRIRTIYELLSSNLSMESLKHGILFVGCGGGLEMLACATLETLPVGLDISKRAVKKAKKRYVNQNPKNQAYFVNGDAENLPFKENCFEVVICSEVLEHLTNPSVAVAEIRRVLRSHGRSIITMPNALSWYGLARVILNLFGVKAHAANQPLDKWLNLWNFKSLIEKNGLKILKYKGVYFTPPIRFKNKIVIVPERIFLLLLPVNRHLDTLLKSLPIIKYMGHMHAATCLNIVH